MGLFDCVYISDPRIVCSEGHDMCDHEFQTKDLGCTYGDAHIKDRALRLDSGVNGYLPKLPFLGRISIYTTCTSCPAFVSPGIGNIHDVWVEFELEIVDDVIRSIVRTSKPFAEWSKDTLELEFMADCLGPMPHAQAVELHQQILRGRWGS